MTSNFMHQIVEMIECAAYSRPSPMEFEMAYQARVATDRIRFATKHSGQFSQLSDQMREAACICWRHSTAWNARTVVSRCGHESSRARAGTIAQARVALTGLEGDQAVSRRMEVERESA
jgi:hypothetical protein